MTRPAKTIDSLMSVANSDNTAAPHGGKHSVLDRAEILGLVNHDVAVYWIVPTVIQRAVELIVKVEC